MKKYDGLNGKHVFIMGLGRSGLSSARLCKQLGAQVTAYDGNSLEDSPIAEELFQVGIELESGKTSPDLIQDNIDLIIKSPGIPYRHPMIQKAIDLNLPIITDVELAYHLSSAPIVAITGTNGKTTVTSLVGHLINQAAGPTKAYLAGNIGIPVSDQVQEVGPEDILVLELSSFQLMGVKEFRPDIALIINVTSAHLDYHSSREEYVQAKLRITKKQTSEDTLIFNADYGELVQAAEKSPAHSLAFSAKQPLKSGVMIKNGSFYFGEEEIASLDQVKIPGKHNLENVCAAIAIVKKLGLSNQAISQGLASFTGVAHRLQFVSTVNDRQFYNDSKATNVLASQQALRSFEEDIVLICGGLDRHEDLTPLLEDIEGHVHAMVVMGENQDAFADLAQKANIADLAHVNTMDEAVQAAYDFSKVGDVVLLSPACASWDQYSSFEVRGQAFIDAVTALQ